MRRLVFVNGKGEETDLSAPPYLITSIDGMSPPKNPIQEQKAPYQDGTSYIDSLLEPRTITMKGVIQAPNDFSTINTHKELLSRRMSGKNGMGALYYYSENTSRKIAAIPVNSPLYANKPSTIPNLPFMISFYCPDPYLLQVEENELFIETLSALLSFPVEFPSTGIAFSEYLVGEPIYVYNLGHVPTPVDILFYGPAENPRIENQTTGEYIQINKTLVTDEEMRINTAF